MGRIIFFVLLAVLIWLAWTIQRRQKNFQNKMSERMREMEERQGIRPSEKIETQTTQCEYCGVYFPQSEAIKDEAGHKYCSGVCRDRARRHAQNH